MHTTSHPQRNYLGDVVEGGGLLTKTEDSYLVEVLGRNTSFFTKRGQKIMDVSIQTSEPLEVFGGLGRQGRIVDGGEVNVFHNLAKYTATYRPRQVTFSSQCKCPVSGSLQIEYTGSIQGSGKIEYLGCGIAELSRSNGSVKRVEIPQCAVEEE